MQKEDIVVLLDAGHSVDEYGNVSPLTENGEILVEAYWDFECQNRVIQKLNDAGIECYPICYDIDNKMTLVERQGMIDLENINARMKKKRLIVISIHVNQDINNDDDDEWTYLRGWSAFTSIGYDTSDIIATCMYEAAHEILDPLNIPVLEDYSGDDDPDFEKDFFLFRHTGCPIVMVRSFFIDNKDDLDYANTEEGKDTYAEVIYQGILKYIEGHDEDERP